jgi:peroxiredoxin
MPSMRVALVAIIALLAGVAAAAAAVILVGDGDGPAPDTAASAPREPLSGPKVRLTGTDVATGAVVGLEKLEGRPVVVTVWGSWCPACSEQVEPLRRFVDTHDDTDFLAVDTQEDAEAARAFLAANNLTVPTIADEDGRVAAKLGVRELPTTLFLTTDHRVATMWEGPAGAGRLRAGLAAARDG